MDRHSRVLRPGPHVVYDYAHKSTQGAFKLECVSLGGYYIVRARNLRRRKQAGNIPVGGERGCASNCVRDQRMPYVESREAVLPRARFQSATAG